MSHELDPAVPVSGGVTLPVEAGQESLVRDLVARWGADALRDSDGTFFSCDLEKMDFHTYATICLVRSDQDYIKQHLDRQPRRFLMSEPVAAFSVTLSIELLAGYFDRKYAVDSSKESVRHWEVIDRTTGKAVSCDLWEVTEDGQHVSILGAEVGHVYTVSFIIMQTWDTTSMYNHMVNQWDREPVRCVDPYDTTVRGNLIKIFEDWLNQRRFVDVVRLTTLAYHFVVDSDTDAKDKYRDWCGYMEGVSHESLQDFEKQYGYLPRAEDFVDQGYYNALYRVPSRFYRDWMRFIQDFVTLFGRDLIDRIHKRGMKSAIFWGDHWIGVEPFDPSFAELNVDILVGACEDGISLRRVADVPHNVTREVRFYPYFFPDVFCPGGDPLSESIAKWTKIRRAMLRRPVDRIGYGGYLSLAAQFPAFLDHVSTICSEFRSIKHYSGMQAAWCVPIRVGILDTWGSLRSWFAHTGPEEKFQSSRPDVVTIVGSNVLECLSGLPVEVRFLSFEELLEEDALESIDVLINDGAAGTAWSGGEWWANPQVVAKLRNWVHGGGAFLGVSDPSAVEHQGRFFQLSDVLGVQKEVGNNTLKARRQGITTTEHFILDDRTRAGVLGNPPSFVYPCCDDTLIQEADEDGHVHMAAKEYGNGRGVYVSSMPFTILNCRLLYRIILWLAGKEELLRQWFSSNPQTECAAYPARKCFAVVNNSEVSQKTTVYDGNGRDQTVQLGPRELKWIQVTP